MYAVQISQSRKAYKTVTGPSSIGGAFDTYRALVNFRAPKGAKVRLVAFDGSTKPRVVRTAVASQISPRSLFERPTVYLPTLDLTKLSAPFTNDQREASSVVIKGTDAITKR
jgi:hypothetical protein